MNNWWAPYGCVHFNGLFGLVNSGVELKEIIWVVVSNTLYFQHYLGR